MDCDDFKEILKEMGYKLTGPRKIVYKVLCENKNAHMNAADVLIHAREVKPDVGTATVYRVLNLFEKINLVYKTDFDDGFSRYEIQRFPGKHEHHHLICEVCGNVTELKRDLLDKLEAEIEKTKGFIVRDHKVKIYGICRKCSMK